VHKIVRAIYISTVGFFIGLVIAMIAALAIAYFAYRTVHQIYE
jgi:hypothetical protein